ncbi:MAG TPA: DUF1254 domain-containing protein [Blastocatellia bacterium]|nr:DUF1254 domain-containing protein [Blastocatellia bacterium]
MMNRIRAHVCFAVAGAVVAMMASGCNTTPQPATNAAATGGSQELVQIATDAYVYGYPLITMEYTRRVSTNLAAPEGDKAPMGQFAKLRQYPDASFNAVTAPNADTLYSTAWLDLTTEPYILSVPDMGDRYFLLPMLDGWTNVFQVPGQRTTGDKPQKYAITGPNWKGGTLPEGVTEYKAPTNMVWILGRTYCSGTPEDYAAVHKLQDEMTLVPLSAYGKPYTPPAGKVDASIDTKTAVRTQVNSLSTEAYFKELATLMKANPPAAADAPILARMAKIGLVPGQDFDASKWDAATTTAMAGVPKAAFEQIMASFKTAGTNENGFVFTTKTGIYGTDYLQRALITAVGLGANRPEDAIYPTSEADATGQPYDGANKYVVHFDKGQLPPVKGFWSLTMYNADYFFVANPINRYSISARQNLKPNADGSIDLYIQNASPGADKESNWLPAPTGKFILMFRFYWPEDAIINGTWKVPAVTKAS